MKRLQAAALAVLSFASTAGAIECEITSPYQLNVQMIECVENPGETSDPIMYPYLCRLRIRESPKFPNSTLKLKVFIHTKEGRYVNDSCDYLEYSGGEMELILYVPAFGWGAHRYKSELLKIKMVLDEHGSCPRNINIE